MVPWHFMKEGLGIHSATAFETGMGMTVWKFLEGHAEQSQFFNEEMAGETRLLTKTLFEECRDTFQSLESLVDIGGGNGTTIIAIYEAFPHIKCTLYDLPHVIANSHEHPNIKKVSGDMFKSVPSAQAVLLKLILHDWTDDEGFDNKVSLSKFTSKTLHGFWCNNDVDLRLARLEHLMDRRPELANSVLLRQNPHNVEQWHRRVKLFQGNPTKQILTFTEAVRTVDPMKAVGKPHTLWISFAKLYVEHNDIGNARVIFDKAVQVNYKTVDNLATVWCEWAEMELKHKNLEGARELMRRATAEPSVEVKRRGKFSSQKVLQRST